MNRIRRAKSRLKERLTSRGLILMYHRVAEPDLDPWGLSVSPGHFSEQLEVLQKYFHPLSLPELLKHIQRGRVPNRAIAVTFDDGYVDNLELAKPLLERSAVPATIFLVTEAIMEGRNFWWDELEWALLQPGTLPDSLTLRLRSRMLEWQLGAARRYTLQQRREDRQRRPWDAVPGTRLAFFNLIWQHLQALSGPERLEALAAICAWAGTSTQPRRGVRALSKDEVKVLGQGDLIELGAHTMTHPSLKALPISQQMDEISGSKNQLEDVIGRPVTSFSYPHGEYSTETVQLVQKTGLQTATTTHSKCVRADTDPFQLPRFQVDDWNGEQFLRRLARWYALY